MSRLDDRLAAKIAKKEQISASEKKIDDEIKKLRRQQADRDRRERTHRLIKDGATVESVTGPLDDAGRNRLTYILKTYWPKEEVFDPAQH